MDEVESYFATNRRCWDELVALNAGSSFYDLEGFKAGKTSLHNIELQEVGDVAGKSLLHLQCHFGLDTLSWARLGARATGADFSEEAIRLARSLSRDLSIPAEFVCSQLYDLPRVLEGAFDMVFTSYGVLCWLPDLRRWAEVIAHFLRPGGTFYVVEQHPFRGVFAWKRDIIELKVQDSYFHSEHPYFNEEQGSYADRDAVLANPQSYEWQHSISDVINAVIGAGLRIEFVHEFPFCVYRAFPFMEQSSDGWWRLPGDLRDNVPLTFSLRAQKP